jgi:hypothetical protein
VALGGVAARLGLLAFPKQLSKIAYTGGDHTYPRTTGRRERSDAVVSIPLVQNIRQVNSRLLACCGDLRSNSCGDRSCKRVEIPLGGESRFNSKSDSARAT